MLLRDPTTPSAVPFRDVFLPTLGRTKRAITMPTTGRTRKRICEEIECNLWVPARHQSTRQRGRDCTSYRFSMRLSQYSLWHRSPTDATITVQHILGLVSITIGANSAHLDVATWCRICFVFVFTTQRRVVTLVRGADRRCMRGFLAWLRLRLS